MLYISAWPIGQCMVNNANTWFSLAFKSQTEKISQQTISHSRTMPSIFEYNGIWLEQQCTISLWQLSLFLMFFMHRCYMLWHFCLSHTQLLCKNGWKIQLVFWKEATLGHYARRSSCCCQVVRNIKKYQILILTKNNIHLSSVCYVKYKTFATQKDQGNALKIKLMHFKRQDTYFWCHYFPRPWLFNILRL